MRTPIRRSETAGMDAPRSRAIQQRHAGRGHSPRAADGWGRRGPFGCGVLDVLEEACISGWTSGRDFWRGLCGRLGSVGELIADVWGGRRERPGDSVSPRACRATGRGPTCCDPERPTVAAVEGSRGLPIDGAPAAGVRAVRPRLSRGPGDGSRASRTGLHRLTYGR